MIADSRPLFKATFKRCRVSHLPVLLNTFVYIDLNRAFVIIVLRGPFGKFVAWHHNSTMRK